MKYFTIEPENSKTYRIVTFGSRVKLGPMTLAALRADKTLRTARLKLADAECNCATLDKLMSDKLEQERSRKSGKDAAK